MLRDTADCEADVGRFAKRVAGSEVVWYLSSGDGPAVCESNDGDEDEGETREVILFFSDEAYARRCQGSHYEDHEIASMALSSVGLSLSSTPMAGSTATVPVPPV